MLPELAAPVLQALFGSILESNTQHGVGIVAPTFRGEKTTPEASMWQSHNASSIIQFNKYILATFVWQTLVGS